MTEPSTSLPVRRVSTVGWVALGLGLALVVTSGLALYRMAATRTQPLPVYGQVADFALTNQDGRLFTLADLRGHVWVADVIFTRCAGPCPKMSRQMKELQQALPPSSKTKLVSLTTDPEFDTPPVLRTYAKRFEADPGRWVFLTGRKADLARLATGSLKLSAVEKSPAERADPNDLFIHSTYLVLVDQQARLRGIFQTSGEGIDPRQVQTKLLAAIRQLERD